MDDDADLVARVRRGDRQAFDDLYDLYADDVFSMCLLILGDPTVARAAAGTAFALVARTRLNPLSNPAGLRSWLLELARGSALAWSGSPQARSIPVPHGVPPEDLLVGAVVPAPASLRVGLARTFDRAAVVAEAAATAVASRRAAETSKISLLKAPPVAATPAADGGLAEPAARVVPLPLMRMDSADDDAGATGHLPAAGGAAAARATPDWRSRPAMAAAAAVVAAVAGLTAAMNWPSTEPRLISAAGVSIVTPQPTLPVARPSSAPAATGGHDATSPDLIPTLAGAYTSRGRAPREVQPRLVEPIARDVQRLAPTPALPVDRPHVASPAPPAVPTVTTPAKPVTPTVPGSTPPTIVTPPSVLTPTIPGMGSGTGTGAGTGAPGSTITVPPPVHATSSPAPAPQPTTLASPGSPPPSTTPSRRAASPSPGTATAGATQTAPSEQTTKSTTPVTSPAPSSAPATTSERTSSAVLRPVTV